MRNGSRSATRFRLAFSVLMVFFIVSASAYDMIAASIDTTTDDNNNNNNNDNDKDGFVLDEDELVRETIAAGRGERDEQGIRDQWLSDEHLGDTFDSRRPISPEVKRLLRVYQLDCEGCDHDTAVRTIHNHVEYLRDEANQQQQQQQRQRQGPAVRVLVALVAILVTIVGARKLGPVVSKRFASANDPARAVLRRQLAADAAVQRQQQQQQQQQRRPPTWLENEQKEVWTAKQEKLFQKALREFAGVRKNERYKLIAEKVPGKSRIECLTHHRMQELMARRNEKDEPPKQQ